MRLSRRTSRYVWTAIAAVLATSFLSLSGSPFSIANAAAPTSRLPVAAMKTVNYFPANAGWSQMWQPYSHAQTNSDFAAIASLGANSVRIIVQPYALGWPNVSVAGAVAFKDALDTAQANNLTVQLTLFDLWGTYDDVPASEQWVHSLLAPYAGDNRIDLVELQNEIDPTNSVAMSWARQMLAYLPSVLPSVPRTLTVRGSSNGNTLSALLAAVPSGIDVIDVHLYSSIDGDISLLKAAKTLAAGRPLFIGEAGLATSATPNSTLDYSQAKYDTLVGRAAQQFGLPYFSPWTLNDFTASGLPSGMNVNQRWYGLRRTDGTWKPAAAVIKAMFAVASKPGATELDTSMSAITDMDGGFENEASAVSSGTLGYWTISYPTLAAEAGTVAGQGVSSSRAAYLTNTAGTISAIPAIVQTFGLGLATSVSAQVSVRLVGATGSTQLSIAWFANDTYISQVSSANAANSTTGWQTIGVAGTPPANATSFQVHLKSFQNQGTAYFDNATVNYS